MKSALDQVRNMPDNPSPDIVDQTLRTISQQPDFKADALDEEVYLTLQQKTGLGHDEIVNRFGSINGAGTVQA